MKNHSKLINQGMILGTSVCVYRVMWGVISNPDIFDEKVMPNIFVSKYYKIL
jgi:hypothetical protein